MVDCGWRENTEVHGRRKSFLLENGQPPNQGILANLRVAELLNELPAFNGTCKLRVQNSPQFGTYFEGLNTVYAQELKIYRVGHERVARIRSIA
jgi:hypothetical protein